MKIIKRKLDNLSFFNYVQNVKNINQYYVTGEWFPFIEEIEMSSFISSALMKLKTQHWLWDEFFVFKAPIDKFKNLNELYFYINHVSHPDPERWLKGMSESNLVAEKIDVNEFKEILNWSIYENFLEPNSLSLTIGFDNIQESIRFSDTWNPLYLGWATEKDYFFINYNGYI